MTVQAFYQTVGAVFLGNVLSLIVVYGLWRATRAEKKLGLSNGADVLPLWLLLAMMLGPAALVWSGLTLQ